MITKIETIHKAVTISTNLDAREAVRNGLDHPLLILADRQDGGRGRQGKVFHSPEGGLYMTLAFPCGLPISETIGVTSCAAAAVSRAIEAVCGAVCGIKWVNDLYLDGGKVCGILVESVNDYSRMISEVLLIGIGVNLIHAPEVTDSSVRAASLAECGYICDRNALCDAIAEEMLAVRENRFDFSLYANEYRARSIVLGREVTFTRNGQSYTGMADAITETGALVVNCGGIPHTLDSGEIHLRVK